MIMLVSVLTEKTIELLVSDREQELLALEITIEKKVVNSLSEQKIHALNYRLLGGAFQILTSIKASGEEHSLQMTCRIKKLTISVD